MRQAIAEGRFAAWRAGFHRDRARYTSDLS